MFSLSTLIDDILLIVRNNNISESEDLSRAQIAAWVSHYKAMLLKREKDQKEAAGEEADYDDSITKTVGPLSLKDDNTLDEGTLYTRSTVDPISDLLDDDEDNVLAVYDQDGCVIQAMNIVKRHFHFFRKYTKLELTYTVNSDNKIVIRGLQDCGILKNIYVKYIADDSKAESEDDVKIPGWMIPEIKNLIFKNELSFMIKMPSDDDNNSTLDGIKPHGPQDQEK